MLKRYFQMLKGEFEGYSAKAFSKDLMAGLTVSAVALPLALAFGVSSGADAAAGLITAILSGLVMSLLSGASFQISGPTGAMTAILISLISKNGINAMFVAGCMAGVILLIAAFLKVGKVVSVLPAPVIVGFTSGIAIIIALGQIDNFFGVTSVGENAIAKLASYATLGFSPNWFAVMFGVLVVLIMAFYPKKLGAYLPASLVSIIIATALNMIFKFDVATVGEIPKSIIGASRLNIADFANVELVKSLVVPAFSIAALAMIESLLCGASASRMKGEKLNSDIELVSQGIGNIIIPFFGGVPSTAAIARTSVAIKSGLVTRLTGIIHAVGLLLAMFAIGPVMSKIPLSALAGVLMVTAFRMNEWHEIKHIFKRKFKTSMLLFFATMIATVVFDLTIAIVTGVVIAIIMFVIQISNIDINFATVDVDKLKNRGIVAREHHDSTVVMYVSGPIFFATAEKISRQVDEVVENGDVKTLICSMRGVPMIDTSGVAALNDIVNGLKDKDVCLKLAAVQPKVLKMLERNQTNKLIGKENIYWSVEQALEEKEA